MTYNPIRNALVQLSRRGWVKGYIEDAQGRVCLLGALSHCSGGIGASTIVEKVIVEQYPERYDAAVYMNHVARFNDHPDTTLEDVVMVMEKAALRLDEQVVA
jgi:galactitol-specific phosphotransferase system IIB component